MRVKSISIEEEVDDAVKAAAKAKGVNDSKYINAVLKKKLKIKEKKIA